MSDSIDKAIQSYEKIVLQCYQKDTDYTLEQIKEKHRQLATLEARIKEYSFDLPCDGPDPINDRDDRKKLIQFFMENVDGQTFQTYALNLFHDKSNVPFLCRQTKLECPQWFLDKYYPGLSHK